MNNKDTFSSGEKFDEEVGALLLIKKYMPEEYGVLPEKVFPNLLEP